jgi:hypothetical protein
MTLSSPSVATGVAGAGSVESGATRFQAMRFLVWQILAKVRIAMPVQVVFCLNTGSDVAPGVVQVQPLVQQMDGNGNCTKHAQIYNVPYLRLQGGTNAVILDPVAGDVGLMAVCDRDFSLVKAAAALGIPAGSLGFPPGSWREFDMSDGIYVGGFLGLAAPTQYVAFSAAGITITSPTAITLNAPSITVTGELTVDGNVTTGELTVDENLTVEGTTTMVGTVTAAGLSVETHIHHGVTTGSGVTAPPSNT